jgi:hypothetical protein
MFKFAPPCLAPLDIRQPSAPLMENSLNLNEYLSGVWVGFRAEVPRNPEGRENVATEDWGIFFFWCTILVRATCSAGGFNWP